MRQFAVLARLGRMAASLERLVGSNSGVRAEMAPLLPASRLGSNP
jgi:hypothetical protein